MNFIGRAERLSDVDLPRIGAEIGVGEDEIHAVLDVESRGYGFDRRGRPVMLFEPHIFWRELGDGPQRDAAARLGLARPRWVRDYPRDSYPRLEQAMKINQEAALRSASWGLGQIMGFNAGLCGYRSAAEMVRDFTNSEAAQLRAMIRFIASAGLDDELRRHDWRGFARGYNGAGYAAHDYHGRLARAYAKWAAIPDTEWKRATALVTAHAEPQEPAEPPVRPDMGQDAPPDDPPPSRPVGPLAAIGAGIAAAVAGAAAFACKLPVLSSLISSCGG